MQEEIGKHTEIISTNKIDWFAEFCKDHDPYKFARQVLHRLKLSPLFDEYISDAVESMWRYSAGYNPSKGTLECYMQLLANNRRSNWAIYNKSNKNKFYTLCESGNKSISEDGCSELYDIIEDEKQLNPIDRIWAKDLIGLLNAREKQIVLSRAYGYTYQEIGDELRISHQRVEEIYKRAVNKIKQLNNK